MAPPGPSSELIDDAIAEIMLRIPPEEPACLVRAGLVCKPWRRILTDPDFPRRYRELHRTPPLLGFLRHRYEACRTPSLVTTTAASPLPRLSIDSNRLGALDCRHGRVLLHATENFVVWDPITGDRQFLPVPVSIFDPLHLCAVVLCAMGGCDHLNCHDGPFLVVSVASNRFGFTEARVYSSEADAWSARACTRLTLQMCIDPMRGVLIGDDIYFTVGGGTGILKYDMGNSFLSLIERPFVHCNQYALMVAEDGSLGAASIRGSDLYLWSRKVKPEGPAGWVECRTINLETIFASDNSYDYAKVSGFAEGVGVIFIGTTVGVFMVEVKSGRVKKVSDVVSFLDVIPIMRFFTPDCARKLPSAAEIGLSILSGKLRCGST